MKLLNSIARGACVGALALGLSGVAAAQEKYLGEVFMTAGMYCPDGSYETSGQTLAISANTALFAVLGTTYGGNGQTTFVLPDLRGRAPVGHGTGLGLQSVNQGEAAGKNTVNLFASNLPGSMLPLQAKTIQVMPFQAGDLDSNGNEIIAAPVNSVEAVGTTTVPVTVPGMSEPIDIRTPFLGMRYCMAYEGIFPVRE
jgi:microcystin-dependent protein